jgi:fumarate reductase flavoprotein subunit
VTSSLPAAWEFRRESPIRGHWQTLCQFSGRALSATLIACGNPSDNTPPFTISDMTRLADPPEFGVIVIGAGGAGLAAALAAAESGAGVLLAEAAGIPGGSTARSSGTFMAAGTPVQEAAGFTDSADAFFDHYLTVNRWACDPAVARRFCDEGWPTMRWLTGHGISYPGSGLYRAGLEPVPRSHRPAGGGPAVTAALLMAVRRAGVEIALGNRVTRLLTGGGRVRGVESRGEHLSASAVVLASGGFAHSEELLARYYPRFAAENGHWSPAAETNVGDGLLMGHAAGAAVAGWNPGITVLTPGLSRDRDPFPPGWLVYVNQRGQRFINECAPYSVMAPAAARQPGGVWNIFDEAARRDGPASREPALSGGVWTPEAIADGVRRGRVARAGTLADLARQAGIDAAGLAHTIARYNAGCDSRGDREFLKDPAVMRPVREPPFYAAPVRPLAMSLTCHGVKIDPDARVLNTRNEAIPGLFAAGEVVGNLIGEQYLGGGNAVGGALTFGRIAGRSAARLAARRP